ncbi:uncharacterized protein KY384_009064 [Bacidia gigantensis]|uniref:uncharacterized protein n=1 Tax=Bacidia gigantensis TaxID=2732470 RepID=UPI001D045A34|nr:uncharacterized protein KY384_009064 [Bacidia gigantensis]KAG8525420.1 hypothetical protein KY384_009064 [Bacidia gigantensis]
MSGENSPPSNNGRSSFASGRRLSDLFGRSPPNNSNGQSNYSGPIATAAANASAQQRRRTSMAGGGPAGSPTSTSSFPQMRNRNGSMASSNSPNSSIEESAIEEGDAPVPQSPSSPFARRLSFGAKALHDIKNGNNSSNEGYNWSEQIRNRAERSASLTQRQQPPPTSVPEQGPHKAASMAIPEQAVKEFPKAPKKPDHFQERILKGDFYMD